MDRLTMMWTDGVYDTFNPVDIADNEYSKINYEEQLTKLGKYEDAGLEPEDIPTVLEENNRLRKKNEQLNKEIPALLNRIDELQGITACRNVEIARLKEKEISKVPSHSENDILEGAISLYDVPDTKVGKWIPVSTEQFPDSDRYILLSFENYSVCAVGRFEDGAFYVGDEDTSLSSIGVFVNAWIELPKCYEESEE